MWTVCLCLSIPYRSQFQTDRHKTLPSCRGNLNWESYWFWGQMSSWVQLSKNAIFHLIDLKFEEDLVIEFNHQLFLRSNLFYGFYRCRVLHEVVSTEKPVDFEVKGHLEVKFLKSSSYWLKIWRGFAYQVTEFNHQLFLWSTSAKRST